MPKSTEPKLRREDKAELTLVLGRVCALQGEYGKTAAELETLVEGFVWVLKDYTLRQILDAIAQYIRKNRDIPKPSDIENIICPPRPKPDWAVYVALNKKIHDGYFPLSDERQFINDCEEYAKERLEEEGEAYRTARQEVTSYARIGMYD